ncbi:Uma2 family endonuclease [Streptomyces tsukubensis]|uniref:Uma2 family endonuclease n=1 Tax=Streptomyces tsukubensis TaxID=83656 RepID=UPI00367EF3C2
MSAARDDAQDDGYEWPRPPVDGWTADDLDRLPDLPPHTELIDGVLVFMSAQANFHMFVLRALENGLVACAPQGLLVIREMTIRLERRTRLEPDLMVVPEDSYLSTAQTCYQPEDLLLAVEITSPESQERDRDVKPMKYARAGIPHFWRVENVNEAPVVYVYELDPASRSYAVTGIHHKQLKLDRPFDVDIDLTCFPKAGSASVRR